MLSATLIVLLLIIVEATVVALLTVDGAPVEVCLNKLVSSSPVSLDLVSPSLPMLSPPPRDPLVNASSSPAPPLHVQVQAAIPIQDSWLPEQDPTGSKPEEPASTGFLLQVSSVAGDEKLPHL
jgi:hypothetical protein